MMVGPGCHHPIPMVLDLLAHRGHIPLAGTGPSHTEPEREKLHEQRCKVLT